MGGTCFAFIGVEERDRNGVDLTPGWVTGVPGPPQGESGQRAPRAGESACPMPSQAASAETGARKLTSLLSDSPGRQQPHEESACSRRAWGNAAHVPQGRRPAGAACGEFGGATRRSCRPSARDASEGGRPRAPGPSGRSIVTPPWGSSRCWGSRPDALHALITGFKPRPHVDVEQGALPAASARARTGCVDIRDSELSVTVSGTVLYSL